MATAEGEYSIPGATITADGNQMVSNSVKIKVLPPDKTGNTADGKGTASSGNQSGTSSSVSNQDLLITATANKTNVYEQEAFLLTFKIYTRESQLRFENV